MPPIDAQRVARILVIQFRPFGDVLLATSYLGALRKRFPRARVDFLVSAPFDQVLRRHPHLDDVIVSPAGRPASYLPGRLATIGRVRRRRYDLVIDQQNGSGSGIVTLASGARCRVGWADGRWRIAHTVHADPAGPRTYTASRNFRMVRPLGVAPEPYRLYYDVEPASRECADAWCAAAGLAHGNFVCLSPGGPVAERNWRPERYAALADLVRRHTPHQVVLLWGPGERETVDRIAAAMAERALIAPATTLNQAAALLQRAAVLVCNNGGMNHLSVAIGVPSVAIFGGTSPADWSPHGIFAGHHHAANPEWTGGGDDSFGLSPEGVFEILTRAIREAAAGTLDLYARG